MRSSTSIAALAGLSAVSAQAIQGFNYGAANSDGSIKDQQRFQDEFRVAKSLVGTCGWASARLYTSIQGGTANTPIAAIPAAIAEDTTMLLGIWCSAGQDVVNNEIAAIKGAIEQYGDEFTSRVVGLSVGSEDLYRISPTGVAAESGYGAGPDELVKYINQARDALKGTALENVKIGHVDTWNDWVNGSNSKVVEAVDWLGFDGYPYFQSTVANGIDNAEALFDESYAATVAAAQGKDVWVTETGWPTSGPEYGQAVASIENARKYWEKVACKLIGKVNTYWYTLQDSFPTTPSPSFGVIGTETVNTPLYDLSCPAVSCPADGENSSSSSSAVASSTGSASSAQSENESATSSAAASVTSVVGGTTSVVGGTTSVVDGTTAVVGGTTTVVAGPEPTYGEGGNEGGEGASATGTVTTVVGGPQPTYGEGGNGASSIFSRSGSSYIADSSVTRVISDIEIIETATSVASATAPGTDVYPPAGTGLAGGSDYGLPTGGPGGNGNYQGGTGNYQGGNGTVAAPTAPGTGYSGGASNTVSGPTSSQFLGAAKATAAPIMAVAAGGLMAVMAAF